MQEVIAPPKLTAVALAKRRTRQPVGEGPTSRVQQKNERQEALESFGIDIGLIGGRTPMANAAPISHCEMTVPMLHCDTYSPIRRAVSA